MNHTINKPLADASTHHHGTGIGLRTRLAMGFASIVLILCAAIAIVLYNITLSEVAAKKVILVDRPTRNDTVALVTQLYVSQSALFEWFLTHDPKVKKEFSNSWARISKIQNNLDVHSKNWSNSEYTQNWETLRSMIEQLKNTQTRAIELNSASQAIPIIEKDSTATLYKILDVLDGPINAEGQRIGGWLDQEYKQLTDGTDKIISDLMTIKITLYTLLVLGILASIFIALYTTRGILHHINIFREYSSRVASGDLTQHINIETNDEIGQLGNDLNTMTESLASITKKITEACHNMVSTLEEVRHAIDVQSSGASEQAASMNQITSSLTEIEKSSAQTMDKAKALGKSAEKTREKGQIGLEAVEQSILGMKSVREKVEIIAQTILDLSNQTQQVGEITAVVNTLAQQSKMLALNASIEAAKAGEAGKGFAVVAAEVKNLAEQSEQSTTQVQKILEDIRHATEKAVMVTEEGTKGVDYGMTLVEQTGNVVRSLSDVIHETGIATQQIEAAIRQESIGIEQITAGMNEINQVTAAFVDSVRQTTEAISDLSDIAKNLKDYVDVYRT